MNSLSRGFRAGGISDYTRVRPKESERVVIARSFTLIASYDIEHQAHVVKIDTIVRVSVTWPYANSLLE